MPERSPPQSSVSASSLLHCQREVLTLQAELEASHAREVHLFEQLARRDACCREQWPSLFLQYANSQRQLLLQQHSDHLRHVDELLVTFRTQHARTQKAHAYELTRLGQHVAESRARHQVRASAAATEVELGMAQAALELRQQVHTYRDACVSTQAQLQRVVEERDRALTRLAELEHRHRVQQQVHTAALQQHTDAHRQATQAHWITVEAMRRSYDAVFASWAAAQTVCDHLATQQRRHAPPRAAAGAADAGAVVRTEPSAEAMSLASLLHAAEDTVRAVCVRGIPPPLLLREEAALLGCSESRELLREAGGAQPVTVYDHVRLCAQLHALTQRSVHVLDAMQGLQEEWQARLGIVEKQGWAPRVARKVLGQDFADRIDKLVHAMEDAQPCAADTATHSPPPPLPASGVRHTQKKAVHQVSVLPGQKKPRFAF